MKKLLCTLTLTAVAAASSQAALIDGLTNYWDFNQNTGDWAHTFAGSASTVADNGTFDGLNGTGGIGYGPGLFGGAGIEQDGAGGGAAGQENNGVVRVPRSADTLAGANATNPGSPNTISTSLWINAAGFDTNWQTMLSHGEGLQYRIARRGGDVPEVAAYAGGSGDIPNPTGGPTIAAGTGWHHIVAISDGNGGSTSLWVDNTLVATGAAPVINDAELDAGGGLLDLFIGGNPDTGAQNREFWGEIDDVAQWNRVLDASEIGQIWGGGPTSARELKGLIPEPSAGVLGLLGLALVLRRRRR